MPASTYQTSGTGRSSPYVEYEEDEFIDLQFSEDPTQAYLSLGLTPLSQIDNFPASNDLDNGGTSENLGFFPSMPPPVSPMSSVFSINTGIPVDSPFNINSGGGGGSGMVMPDAFSTDTTSSRRPMVSRKGKIDLNAALSQGYALTLETVPEQSGSLDVDNGLRNGGHIGIITNGNAESSSDSFEDQSSERDNLFPSADISGSNLSLTRQKGVRMRSGVRRGTDYLPSDGGMSFLNKDFDTDVDLPVKIGRHGSLSPSEEDRIIRQQAREKIEARERAKQKELRLQRLAEDSRRNRLLHEQRAKSGWDYGATRSREASSSLFPQNNVATGFPRRLSRDGGGQGIMFDKQGYQREYPVKDGGIIKKKEQLTTL